MPSWERVLIGSGLGTQIDSNDAVFRVNLAPSAEEIYLYYGKTYRANDKRRWKRDIGSRTTWRVATMEVYAYLTQYPRNWLAPPNGHGIHSNMSDIPLTPKFALFCHHPGRTMGRCGLDRLNQIVTHPRGASLLVNPLVARQLREKRFRDVRNQKVPSTGMIAMEIALRLCNKVHLYGFPTVCVIRPAITIMI